MEKKKAGISLGTCILMILLVIAIIAIVVMVVKNNQLSTEKMEAETKVSELETTVTTMEETVGELQGKMDAIADTISSKNSTSKQVDVSIDEQKETITVEGVEEQIVTKKYVSSLGYSMRYDTETFNVSKDEEMDVYSVKNDENAYCTVERHGTSYDTAISSIGTYEKETINGNEAAYVTKTVSGTLQKVYYLKANDGVYIITTYYPNTSEAEEGIGSRMERMIQTFAIN